MTSHPEIFFGHVTEPELATRLEVSTGSLCLPSFLPFVRNRTRRVVSDYCEQGRRFCAITPNLINSRFATSQRDGSAIYSTCSRRILSACGAPAAVWTTLTRGSLSPLYFFTDTRDGNIIFRKYSIFFHLQGADSWYVQDGWMALRFPWRPCSDSLDLLSEPYLSDLKDEVSDEVHPRLYFCYNARTRQTTIMTTNLVQLYLHMVQHLDRLPKMPNRPECPEWMVQALVQCFAAVREYFVEAAEHWDNRANSGVCCGRAPVLGLMSLPISQQEMISKTFNTNDHLNNRVLSLEYDTGVLDRTRGDFIALHAALTSLERHLQDLWSTLNLRLTFDESLGALFKEQRELCEVTRCLYDSLLSRYDRYLSLVQSFYPYSNGCLI